MIKYERESGKKIRIALASAHSSTHDIRYKYATRSPYDLYMIFLCLFALNIGDDEYGMGVEIHKENHRKVVD